MVGNTDGSGAANLTNSDDKDFAPQWSPDGSRIAFNSRRERAVDIYVMKADGSAEVNLTQHPANDSFPQWSPDGSRILFSSNRAGTRQEIYSVDADGSSNPTRLTANDYEDFQPAWSPDGKHIVFIRFIDGSAEVYTMAADGSQQARLTHNKANEAQPIWSPVFGAHQ